jgi:hypothetical protein
MVRRRDPEIGDEALGPGRLITHPAGKCALAVENWAGFVTLSGLFQVCFSAPEMPVGGIVARLTASARSD